jgi:hypothetical protein
MLNPVMKNKLERPEYRFIYDLSFRLTDYTIKQVVQKAVKELRAKYRAAGVSFKDGKEIETPDEFILRQKKYPKPGDWARSKMIELAKLIYEHKNIPDTFHGMWRSIEFEAIFRSQQSLEDFANVMRVKKLSKWVEVKDDGSIRTDENDRGIMKEVVVSYKAGDEDMVRFVCEALNDPAVPKDERRAYVNNTCGTHIHFDMRNANEKQVQQYGARLGRCVPALKAILPKSRRNNKFCMAPVNDINGGKGGDTHHIDQARYAFVNLQSYHRHKTIEIRGHSATLRADKILNWIALCEKIMTSRIRFKSDHYEIRDPNDLIKAYKLDDNLSAYVKERFSKFNTAKDMAAYTGVVKEAPIYEPAPGEQL